MEQPRTRKGSELPERFGKYAGEVLRVAAELPKVEGRDLHVRTDNTMPGSVDVRGGELTLTHISAGTGELIDKAESDDW